MKILGRGAELRMDNMPVSKLTRLLSVDETSDELRRIAYWKWVRVGDFTRYILQTLHQYPHLIRGDVDMISSFTSLAIRFGHLMSESRGFRKDRLFTYAYNPLGFDGRPTRGIDFYIDEPDITADGRATAEAAVLDAVLLVPAGWANSVAELVNLGVWGVDYSERLACYVARITHPAGSECYITRRTHPRWGWDLGHAVPDKVPAGITR